MGNELKKYQWAIIIFLATFILTFFIFFRETHESMSSIFASIMSALLILGTWIIGGWIVRVFTK